MPDTLEALGILVLFFVPGFVATQVYVRNDPTADASHPKYLLSVAVWSAIVHVVVFPWTADVLTTRDQLLQRPDVFVRWFVVFLLITPALLGMVVGVLVRTRIVVASSACGDVHRRQHADGMGLRVPTGSSWRVRSCPPAGRRRPAGWQAREEVPRGGQSRGSRPVS